MAFYNATGGPNWTNNTNWLTDNDISTWYGVTVFNGQVTRLFLKRNNLTNGEIPTELGNLTNLRYLYLTLNQLSGGIPTELGNLSNLEWLLLNDNTSLMGALPQSLTGLTKLRTFRFNNTGLCAPLDPAFQAWLEGIATTSGDNCSE